MKRSATAWCCPFHTVAQLDALWAHTAEPLPSPATYFRRKYALSDEQIAELEAAVERITNIELKNT